MGEPPVDDQEITKHLPLSHSCNTYKSLVQM